MAKKALSERDICTKFIMPAVQQAGWDVLSQVREKVYFTKGRIIVRGKIVTRGQGKKADFKSWMTRGFPEVGDLFFTTEAPLVICLNDIEEPFALAQRAICFQPYAKIDTPFLMFALMSDVMQSLIDKHATGMTAKGIKAANLKPLPIPIPPLAEQHRIVTKVDALMALCDRLEASLTATAATRRRLLDALLAGALGPDEVKRAMEAAE